MSLRVCQRFHYKPHFQGFRLVESFNNALYQTAVLGEKINIIIQKVSKKCSLLMKTMTAMLSGRKWIVPKQQAEHILTQTYSYLYIAHLNLTGLKQMEVIHKSINISAARIFTTAKEKGSEISPCFTFLLMLMQIVCMHLEKNSQSPKELYYLLKYIHFFFFPSRELFRSAPR